MQSQSQVFDHSYHLQNKKKVHCNICEAVPGADEGQQESSQRSSIVLGV